MGIDETLKEGEFLVEGGDRDARIRHVNFCKTPCPFLRCILHVLLSSLLM